MVALRSLALAALALSSPLLVAADDGEWIEFYDKASNKKAYYHSVTRQSAWEAPEGAKVKYMTAEDTSSAQSGGSAKKEGKGGTVLVIILLPIVLVLGGLLVLYHMASQEGLMEVLRSKGKQRDRSQARVPAATAHQCPFSRCPLPSARGLVAASPFETSVR
jgi:hypothetical protein